MKVLLAIDESDSSKQVIAEAASMELAGGSELMVLSALDFLESLPGQIKAHALEETGKMVHQVVEELRLAHPNVTVTGVVPDGFVSEEILSTCTEWKPDLVMVGTRERSGLTYLLLGSVSRRLLLNAACPVRIVRVRDSKKKQRGQAKTPVGKNEANTYNVLIAIDDKESAFVLIDHVSSLSWPKNTKFKCLNVVPERPAQMLAHLGIETVKKVKLHYDEMVAYRMAWLEAAVIKLNDKLGDKLAKSDVLRGEPATAIIETARDWPANLVILGSHGRQGLDKIMLGSVSEAVAIHADSSVQIVPLPMHQFKR